MKMKMLEKAFVFVLFLNLIFGCSNIQSQKLKQNEQENVPTKTDVFSPINNDSVTIPLKPETATTTTPIVQGRKEPVLAIILGPGLNRSVAHISLLRVLEQKGIKIQMIEGHEMGAIVAALYARYLSAERVEWFFYKYFRKNDRQEPYSSNWKKDVEEELLGSFGKDVCRNLTIENLKMDFTLPLFSNKDNKINYWRSGQLCSMLMVALNPINDKQDQSGAFELSIYNSSALKKAGADIVIGVDVLGNKIVFRKEIRRIKDVYEKVLKVKNIEKNYVDYFISLPTEEMPLDGVENLPLVSKKSLLYSEKMAGDILEKIKKWKEKNP